MSNAALTWAFPVPVTGPRKSVLIALAEHCDEHGGCWPAVTRLALFSGVCERTVRTVLHHLEQAGLVLIDRSEGRTSNRYTLAINTAPDAELIALAEAPRGRRMGQPPVDNDEAGAPLPDESTLHGAHLNGAAGAPLPCTGLLNGAAGAPDPARGAPEPLKNPQLTLIEPSTEPSPARASDHDFAAMKTWNEICGTVGLPRVAKFGRDRTAAFTKVFKSHLECDMARWRQCCETIASSDFLTGGTFSMSIDWTLKPANLTKILEGNYRNRQSRDGKLSSIQISDVIRNGSLREETPDYMDLNSEEWGSDP